MIETGLIYRNPKPHLYSRQASFPSLALLPNGEMLAAFGVGAGFESADNHTELSRSLDGGRSWTLAGAVFNEGAARPTSSNVRISRMPDGELVANGIRAARWREDEGLSNPETQGFVETELIMCRSADEGRTWMGPAVIAPPLVGPAFEVCSPILPLSEQKLIDLGDGRPLAVCWTHDLTAGADRQVHYALSSDNGRSFGPPRPTGLHGQTSTPVALGDGRLVCVYRRTDKPGLWAAYARISGDAWLNEGELALWGHVEAGAANIVGGENLSRAFTTLKFGLPAGLVLPDGRVFIAFWCVEECLYVIRWICIDAQISTE